ncbi:MAG: hypothetical protein WCC57_15130 [Paracoccaceae bacterium]
MFPRAALWAFPFIVVSTSAAFAKAPTPEGAAHLIGVFQSYLGTTEGVVSVELAGEAYAVSIDFAVLAGLIAGKDATVAITPIEFSLTDQGDGTWAMQQDQALSMKLVVPGVIDSAHEIGSFKSEGVFDENLAAFTNWTMDFTNLKIDQVISDPEMPTTDVTYTIASGHSEQTVTAGETAGVDVRIVTTLNDLVETFKVPATSEEASSTDISLAAKTYASDGTIVGLRTAAVHRLLAWIVAHPSEAAMKADQAALKVLLTEGLPFFGNMNITGTMNTVNVTTPIGVFGAETAGIVLEANGLVENGLFREGFDLAGLSIPEGLAPAWGAALVPDSLSFDVKGEGFNLAAPAARLIAAFDLNDPASVNDGFMAGLLPVFLPKGAVDITLAPGHVTNATYDLRYEGVMTAGPGAIPTGRGRITAAGLDQVTKVLSAAPPEVSGQIVPMLGMAQGMGKAEADGTVVWEIDAMIPGSLLVNGVDLAAMMGGQ